MIESLAKEINAINGWNSIETILSNIHTNVKANSRNVDEKTFNVLTILCSPLAPSNTVASNSRYTPSMLETNCAEKAVKLAGLLKNAACKRNLYDYAWCCGNKNLVNEIPIDINSLFLQGVDVTVPPFTNFKLLLRAIAIAVEENNSTWKKNSIEAIKIYFENLWASEQFADAAQFLEEIDHQLQNFQGLASIFSDEYAKTIELLELKKESDFTCLRMLSRILELENYRYKVQVKNLKAGHVHELLAKHAGNEITKLHCLEQAEIAFNNADSTIDAKRVSIERFNLGKTVQLLNSKITLPQEITKPLHEFSDCVKNEILQMEFSKSVFHLGNDPFLFRLNEKEFDIAIATPIQSPFDIPGIVTSINISNDGRTSKQADGIEYKNASNFILNWKINSGIKLIHFNDLIFKQLNEDLKDVQNRFKFMVKYLSETTGGSENSYYKVNRMLNAFRNSLYFDFMNMAIPYIEESLRYLLSVCSINPLQLKNEEGIPTQYKTMDFLFRNELKNEFPENIPFTLQMILTKGRYNVGLNLRNDVAHGILRWNEFDQFNSSLLLAVMFILSRVCLWKKNNS